MQPKTQGSPIHLTICAPISMPTFHLPYHLENQKILGQPNIQLNIPLVVLFVPPIDDTFSHNATNSQINIFQIDKKTNTNVLPCTISPKIQLQKFASDHLQVVQPGKNLQQVIQSRKIVWISSIETSIKRELKQSLTTQNWKISKYTNESKGFDSGTTKIHRNQPQDDQSKNTSKTTHNCLHKHIKFTVSLAC